MAIYFISSFSSLNFLTYFILTYLISEGYCSDCVFIDDGLKTNDANSALMTRLDQLRDKTFKTQSNVDGKQLQFYFQLCGNPSSVDSACKSLQNANVVEVSEGNCVIIGNFNQTNIYGADDWVSVAYRGSILSEMSDPNKTITRETVITFICDANYKEETFSLAHINHCMGSRMNYNFIINSASVCPKQGLTGGSVFCILFFTFLGTYLLFGLLYKRFILKAKGFEQIPNYESWKELGGLIADGCDFLCRCDSRQSNKFYQGIDDSFSNPNENPADDHLLPM